MAALAYYENHLLTPSAVLETLNDAAFEARHLDALEKEGLTTRLSRWIGGSRIPPAGMRLYTGEALQTNLAARRMLALEALRGLLWMGVPWTDLRPLALHMLTSCFAAEYCIIGECAHAAAGWMRCLATSFLPDSTIRLEAHLRTLANDRDSHGRWRHFPFYYTLLTLTEINLPAAKAELRYAAPAVERAMQYGGLTRRRQAVAERALAIAGVLTPRMLFG